MKIMICYICNYAIRNSIRRSVFAATIQPTEPTSCLLGLCSNVTTMARYPHVTGIELTYIVVHLILYVT